MSKFLIYRDEQVRQIGLSGKLYSFKRDANRNPIPVEVEDIDAEQMLNTGKFMVDEKSFVPEKEPEIIKEPKKFKRRAYRPKSNKHLNDLNY